MKKSSAIVLLLLVTFAHYKISAQEDIKAKHNAYFLCINNMEKEPQNAYQLCSDYLQKYPDDDERLVKFVGQWMTAYGKILVYLNSVQMSLNSDPKRNWMIYEPDLDKKILNISVQDKSHKIEIERKYNSPGEDKYLKKAEAVYPTAEKISMDLVKNWRFLSQPEYNLPNGEPKWWSGYADTILQTETVTTSAIIYYQKLSEQLKQNNNKIKENSFAFHSTEIKYLSSIRKLEKYERGGKVFKNIYVADMTLTWSQICGSLCGYGFTRNKVVVLDEKGNVLEMFLDSPENNRSWVS